jgi:hypothetical protein
VYLFARCSEIGRIFGPHYGGTVLLDAGAILVAEDNRIEESVRHEFTHLLSAKLNLVAPPLVSEGLSVWLQETTYGWPIDVCAGEVIETCRLSLTQLLKPRVFFDREHSQNCYVLAGSFTGFLIRRYGWESYRKFYRRCNGHRFLSKFRLCFGMTLEHAENLWRSELSALKAGNSALQGNN